MKFAFSSGIGAGWWRCKGGVLAVLLCLCAFAPARADDLFAEIVKQAQEAAAQPFRPNESTLPEVLRQLNYDTYRDITFREDRSLWEKSAEPFKAQFFHPGYLFDHPVTLHEVVGGAVRPLPFSTKYFRYPNFDPASLQHDATLGFAGFRLLYPLNRPGRLDEVISFLGSNYFRALGKGQVYGLSARGIAIDTGENLAEEFPVFREFWLCKPTVGAREMRFFARLDGPSVSGAYQFLLRPGADTQVEVEARLFLRKTVQVLGVAPLTSMYWRGKGEPAPPNDKRPEVHDSDGLLIGKNDWHPLHAVDRVTTQIFSADNPRSFALLQRDRDPAHYRDREAHYERRPSVRVESLGDWGAGALHLFQLPAQNEYNDNVVLFWEPEKAPQAGEALLFRYRLHWFTETSNKP